MVNNRIIDEAVNHSINDFLLNEGFGDAVKGVYNTIKGPLKDGFKAWMDWGTKGRFSQRFGWKSGLNRFNELRYFKQWLDWHRNKIMSLNSYMTPGETHDLYDFTPDGSNNGKGTIMKSKFQNATQYIKQYCNSDSFNSWISQHIDNYGAIKPICDYIDKFIYANQDQKNLRRAINNCNIGVFLDSQQGKQYFQIKNKDRNFNWEQDRIDRQAQEQQRQQQQAIQQKNDQHQQHLKNGPAPTTPNGAFKITQTELKDQNGWIYGNDAKGYAIYINPQNPFQARFAQQQ